MAEATANTSPADEVRPDPAEQKALEDAARAFDNARLRQIGGFHFALVMGALTLWGAAETWAQVTGWTIAHFASVANAFVAAYVLHSTIHEWGHFTGARLSGAVSPVLDAPRRHFFMFDFAMDQNDLRQFTWMSWGGILAPWLTVLLVLIFVPFGSLGAIVLLATLIAKATGTALFEAPVVLGAAESGEPGAELAKATTSGGLDRGRKIGNLVGLASFAVIWLVA